jgi:hypothetical protein
MATGETITIRLVIGDPVPGVTYSLQDAKSTPVEPVVAGDAPISFNVVVKVAPATDSKGPKFQGPFVRREGSERRFIYIAIGGQAGDHASPWSRRVKVDIHDLSAGLLKKALAGRVLEARLAGRDKDGGPACATQKPLHGWRIAD